MSADEELLKRLRVVVAWSAGLPEAMAERLRGSTRSELEEDAGFLADHLLPQDLSTLSPEEIRTHGGRLVRKRQFQDKPAERKQVELKPGMTPEEIRKVVRRREDTE